jgi:GT2 family glycosyltransferase
VSYRLREAGYTLKYVPSATVWHYTYESAGQVKPAQYVGSIIGNIYLRTRYGTLKDLLFVVPLMVAILMQSPFKGSRRKLMQDFVSRYLRYLPQLLCERKTLESCAFPFRLLDYEQQREGAFWEAKKPAVAADELPLVSIVTRTVAGRDQLLKQAGLTVLNQTYPNIEWVVVEDGGEAQRPIVESLMDGRDGVKVTYEGLEKVGRSAAGNRGMEIASGQWLMFLDDDDCLYADHVETLMDELLGDDGAAAAYSLAWEVESMVKDGGRDIKEASYHQVASLRQPFDYQKLRQCNYIPIQAIIFKADLYKNRGGFDTDLDYLEDWHIWQRYAHNNRFVYVPKTTSMYRTPMDSGERARRQQLLDDAYLDVKARSKEAISALGA